MGKAGRKLNGSFFSFFFLLFFFPRLVSAVDRLDPLAVDEAPVIEFFCSGGKKGRKKKMRKEKR